MAARRGKSQARRTSGNGTPGWVWLVAGAAIAAVVFLAVPGLFKKDGDGFLRAGPQPNPDAQPAPVADTDVLAPVEATKPAAKPAASASAPADDQTQYDFYTLLPGKEVRVSDAELAASARAEEAARAKAALEGRTPATTVATTAKPAVAPTPLPETAPSAPKPLPEPAAAVAVPAAPATASTAVEAAPAATAASPAAATAGGRYILQAGSFGASGEAESTKARLAMLGLAARVESAAIGGKTVYRVRMGPYASASELAAAKQKLAGTGLPAIAIKAQ